MRKAFLAQQLSTQESFAWMLNERLTAMHRFGMALGLVGAAIIINPGPIPLNAQTHTAVAASIAATCLYGCNHTMLCLREILPFCPSC